MMYECMLSGIQVQKHNFISGQSDTEQGFLQKCCKKQEEGGKAKMSVYSLHSRLFIQRKKL